MEDVIVEECCFSTPRIIMHRCLASTTTPTPCGLIALSITSAICVVRRSCTCQADARRERSDQRRIRQAPSAESKTLESFNWKFNPKAFARVHMEELAPGESIRRRTNLS